MASTFTLTATPQPSNSPPRVKLDVTQTGTPALSSVTLNRIDADGRTRPVRTTDGGPLAISGGVGLVYDNEIPYGTAATYQIAENNAPTASATLDVDVPWLIHLGTPTRSVPINLRIGSHDEEVWGIEQGVFPILGREEPIVITGTTRTAPAAQIILAVDTPSDLVALKALLADGSPLLLNVPGDLSLGIDTDYIAVGPVSVKRRSSIGTAPYRDVTLPYQVVSRPAGGTKATVTWADVASQYTTWSSIPAGKTWAQLAAGS